MTATTPDRAHPSRTSARLPAPGEFGPRISGGRPRDGGPDWLRLLGITVAGLMSVVLMMGGYYAALLVNAERTRDRVDIVRFDERDDSGATDGSQALALPSDLETLEDRTTILLVGSDSRDGLSDEQLQAIGTTGTGTDLTDTIILLQVDPATDAAAMLSFPRDLLVTRCDGTEGKINEAFFIGEQEREGGGAQCLIDTITALTSIYIDHYVRVDFAGFVRAVDALGGVSFYLDEAIRDANSGLNVPSGCVEFDGIKAIQFVRARGIDSDFGRIARQQRFAREMVREAASANTLLNPATVTSLVRTVSQTLETDTEFGVSQMASLLSSVQGISSGSVDGRTVPGYLGWYGRASVVRLDPSAEQLFRAFRDGDLLPAEVGTGGTAAELGPANVVPIVITNGAAEPGVEDETEALLTALGYTVSGTSDEGNYGFSSSVIFYPEERKDHAELLAESLGGIQISQRADDADELQLILGSSFDPADFAPDDEPLVAASPSETPAEDPSDEPAAAPSEEEFTGAQVSDVTC